MWLVYKNWMTEIRCCRYTKGKWLGMGDLASYQLISTHLGFEGPGLEKNGLIRTYPSIWIEKRGGGFGFDNCIDGTLFLGLAKFSRTQPSNVAS